MEIPNFLVEQVRDGNVVLFLGSGASIGAVHKNGIKPPIGNELSDLIANNYNAQFWYARSIYLANEISDAYRVFKVLGDSKANLALKKEPQAMVQEDNTPKIFHGRIMKVEHSHAFVIKDGTGDRVFAYRYSGNRDFWDELKPEKRVTFVLMFNYRGPVATNIKPE